MEEEVIVEKVKRDSNAYDKIYKLYHQKIFVYVFSFVKNQENAEDITSIVFEKALKGINSFQWEGVSLQSWLYKIARNTINDFYRKAYNKFPSLSMDQEIGSMQNLQMKISDVIYNNEDSIELQIIKSDEEEKLYAVLQLFGEEDQYLLYYKYFETMSNKQIAKILEISETNVGTKLQRIRIKIKNFLTI